MRGIDDHFVTVTFAVITGPLQGEVEQKLRRAGRSLEESTLWQWAKSEDPKERSFALGAFAAISQKTADPRVVELYQAALKDADPVVRKALIEAVGRAAWPELWPVVDALAEAGDEDSRILRESYDKFLPRSN